MAQFCYRCECGVKLEETHRVGHAPETALCLCGARAPRDFAAENKRVDSNACSGYPYVSDRLPRKLDGCDHTEQGKPVVRSRTHEREIMAQGGYERD